MDKITMTYEVAHAAAMDAAAANARLKGRLTWNAEDHDVARKRFDELWPGDCAAPVKLCKDCTHYIDGDPSPLCQHDQATIPDLVHGTRPQQYSCEGARLSSYLCGKDAVWFEAKEDQS